MSERLPIENLDEGLYVHERDRVLELGYVVAPEKRYYVDALLFMEVQRERDGMRRTLGFVNEAIRRGDTSRVIQVLNRDGFTHDDAVALRGIMEWAAGG